MVHTHHRTKKTVIIEDTNSTGKVDDVSTLQRFDEKKEMNVELDIVWNEPSKEEVENITEWAFVTGYNGELSARRSTAY